MLISLLLQSKIRSGYLMSPLQYHCNSGNPQPYLQLQFMVSLSKGSPLVQKRKQLLKHKYFQVTSCHHCITVHSHVTSGYHYDTVHGRVTQGQFYKTQHMFRLPQVTAHDQVTSGQHCISVHSLVTSGHHCITVHGRVTSGHLCITVHGQVTSSPLHYLT